MQNLYLPLIRHIVLLTIGLSLFTASTWAQCINTFPYFEDFEATDGGWTAGTISPGGIGISTWVWDAPINPVINSANSGVNCWITRNDNNNLSLPSFYLRAK